ncbi:hypothetical protein KGM_215163 [Danaus plexippus plexippus]|uniref:Uncharacterized protein n=1 Tax=Danaus plexippus plexippus TaxID=278856 RepID=A0A212FP02_DANPL|nr:hypothetical protein KGM_215163 [Danaus plexippus plexippus]
MLLIIITLTDITQAILDLPTLDLKLSVRGVWFDVDCEQDKRIRQPPGKNEWIQLHADQVMT